MRHSPSAHPVTALADRHTRSQAPQLAGSLSRSKPSSVCPSQSLSSSSPQRSTSGFRHASSQPSSTSPLLSTQPSVQLPMTHSPRKQSGVALSKAHTTSQRPQCCTSPRRSKSSSTKPSQSLSSPSQASTPPLLMSQSASQPVLGSESPSYQPAWQWSMRHWPSAQRGSAWSRTQGWLQAPQWSVSACRSKPSSTTPLQSLSARSQSSMPPLLGVQRASQPVSVLSSASM